MTLTIVYPALPPTSNKIYFRGTILKREARKWAEDFSKFVVTRYLPEIMELDRDGCYALHLRFYFHSLVNPTYKNLDVPAKKRAKTWYKKLDLSNRIKLIEDCIRDAIDVDDSQTFSGSQEKHHDPDGQERVEIHIQQVDPSLFGLPRRPA